MLFNESIEYNISYGNIKGVREDRNRLLRVIQQSRLEEVTKRMPGGLGDEKSY